VDLYNNIDYIREIV